jgi:hypothetical protein
MTLLARISARHASGMVRTSPGTTGHAGAAGDRPHEHQYSRYQGSFRNVLGQRRPRKRPGIVGNHDHFYTMPSSLAIAKACGDQWQNIGS